MKNSIQLSYTFIRSLVVMAVLSSTNLVSAANMDARLVGHWRNTVHQPAVNYAQDAHYQFFQDGSFELYAKGISNGRRYTEGPVYGRWSANGSALTLNFNTGEQEMHRYQTNTSTLLLIDQTDYRLWNRLR